MRACHNTSERHYRTPLGALPMGDTAALAIDVWDEPEATAELRLWTDDGGETIVAMEGSIEGDHIHFTAELASERPSIVWYSFRIYAADGSVWRYGAAPNRAVGEGAFAYGEPPSFQLTVYERRRRILPEWFKQAVVYQIFPDSFARGSDWKERSKVLDQPRHGAQRRLVDWGITPRYERNDDDSIATWDFYGGTLEGIREKLDYLEGLGITCIYLNPIFEATSSHRYDTANYLKIDSVLGDEKSFTKLCEDAASHGISIILDGVFNHTGDDSLYFNRYGNYPDLGAWQSEDSPYRGWYKFDENGEYSSWWGIANMPDLEETNPEYHELICGDEGVVRHWLRAGARGWRLDVADELPDDFIADIKRAALAERDDAVLIGEVWEDATTKRAYGELRQYFWGDELDGTMNYPWRHTLLHYILGRASGDELAVVLETLRENYPRESFYTALNILGSHDRVRLLTILGDTPKPNALSEDQKASFCLNKDHRNLAISRLWVAALMQMTLPGVPCIYYGDEAGCEGYADPYNRASFPWGHEDLDCQTIYRNAIALRKSMPVMIDGDFEPFAEGDDVLGYWRWDDNETVCVLVNRSLESSHKVSVEMRGETVSDVISGDDPEVCDGKVSISLWPLGTAVLYFRSKKRLQKPMPLGMGLISHITSIPNDKHPGQPGTLGAPAKHLVDWMARTGQRYWQMLPVNPTDRFGSPYAGLSAFSGNPRLLEGGARAAAKPFSDSERLAEYHRFCEENEAWLLPAATFAAIKELVGEKVPWQKWPKKYHSWSRALVKRSELKAGIARACRQQFEFQRQWDELHEYARKRGIFLIGDMPIYVSADSADVWSEPEIFDLDAHGYPAVCAGAPPDSFSEDGQYWGNPTYNWDELRRRGYSWWMRRFQRMISLYDYVRLDHFLGFSSFYCIPRGASAKKGQWRFGPGIELFQCAHRHFGDLPFIAEDLGAVTPAVRALLAESGFAGMDVVQFVDGDVRSAYRACAGKITYASTHDTSTLLGWCKESFGNDDAEDVAKQITSQLLNSDADVVMLSLQDVIGLDDKARMNKPGVAEGNWSWQATAKQMALATEYTRQIALESGRFAF